MITRKEFYFLRHGETDHNANKILAGGDCDVPLNQNGKVQSQKCRSKIDQLNVNSISYSPLQRAKQTMEIATNTHSCNRWQVPELKECLADVWIKMTSLSEPCAAVEQFFKDVLTGVNFSLKFKGTPLLVAHGGVHWAICHLLSITQHPWDIGNCELVHFIPVEALTWKAQIIE